MKDQFHVFNVGEMPELDSKNKELLVVLDTNILLHVLRYSKDSREKLFQSIEKVKSRLFIPYIVGLEYNINKKDVMYSLKNAESSFKKKYEAIKSKTIKDFNTEFNQLGSKITSSDEAEVRKKIKEYFTETLNETFGNFFEKKVREELNLITVDNQSINRFEELYEGKVAEKPEQSWITKIEEKGKERYDKKIPPGYMDNNKTDISIFYDIQYQKKYGDLILWEEIIKRAEDEQIKKVIFISDDLKEDWIFKINDEEIGVRAELREELWIKAKADLFLLNSNQFLSLSGVGEEITKRDNINLNRNNIDVDTIDEYFLNENEYLGRKKYISSELKELMDNERRNFLKRLRTTITKVRILIDKINYADTNYIIYRVKNIIENLDILMSSNIIEYECDLDVVKDLDLTSERIRLQLQLDNNFSEIRIKLMLDELLSVLRKIEFNVDIETEENFK